MAIKKIRTFFEKIRFLKDIIFWIAYVGSTYYTFSGKYISSLPRVSKISICVFVTFMVLAAYFFYKLFQKTKLQNILIANSGLFYFRKNTIEKDKKENERLLLEEIKTTKNIEIIGATGYNTFAKPEHAGENAAILRDAIEKDVMGEIKILLLHPRGKFTRMRASSLGVPIETYKQEIYNSIAFLKELRGRGKSISLKLYKQRPVWKMIIIDKFLWLQHYVSNLHVESSPVYGIYKNRDGESLFDPLYGVFLKKWKFDNNPTYDFDNDLLVYPEDEKGEIKKENICDLNLDNDASQEEE